MESVDLIMNWTVINLTGRINQFDSILKTMSIWRVNFKFWKGSVRNAWRKTPVSSFNTTYLYMMLRKGMGSWAPPLHLPFHNMCIDIMKKHDYWFLAPPHAPSNIPSVWESNGPHRTIIWSAGLPISNPPPTLLLGVSPRSSYIITLLISSFFAAQWERVFLC